MSSDPRSTKRKPSTKISYKDWLVIKHYRPRSISTLLSLHRQLENYLSKEKLSLSVESLLHYAHWTLEQGYSGSYERQIYWGLKSYYQYLKLLYNASTPLYLPKLCHVKERRKALTKHELAQLENWLSENRTPLRKLLYVLFYGCGLRRREAENLQLLDLNYSDKYLLVKTLKHGDYRELPLSSYQLDVFKAYIEKGRPVPKANFAAQLLIGPKGGRPSGLLSRELANWQQGSELGRKLCWHVLRHTIATNLVNSGLDIRVVSHFLGHRSWSSTHHYLHYQKEV